MSFLPQKLGNIVHADGRETGADLRAAIGKRASELSALGMREGSAAALVIPNSAGFFVNLFAIWELGGCAIPVSPAATEQELKLMISAVDPMLVVRADGAEKRGGDALNPGIALLLFTSGTTSDAKAVMISYAALQSKLKTLARIQSPEILARTLCLLPVSFGHGLIGNSLPTLLSGGELHLPPPFSSGVLQNLGGYVDQHAISFFSSVPALWSTVLPFAEPPKGKTLKRVFCASAALPTEKWREAGSWLGAGVDFRNVYGITEAASWISALPEGEPYTESGAVGSGWDCQFSLDHATAEVLVRAPYLMSGYQRDEAATRKALVDGWLRTGDLGELSNRGSLRLIGRLKDQINRGGQKISPAEVEYLLARHPAVSECCVFGIGDEVSGESVGAAVVAKGSAPSGTELRVFLRGFISEYKIPEKFFFVTKLPRNARGKVNREEVAAVCAEGKP